MSHLKLKEGEQIKASFNIKGAGKKPKVIKPIKGRSFIKGPGLLAPPPSPKASKKKNKSAKQLHLRTWMTLETFKMVW